MPREILDRSLSGKVLDGWLQNRIQIFVPLTFSLGRLGSGDVAPLMRFAGLVAARSSSTGRRRTRLGAIRSRAT